MQKSHCVKLAAILFLLFHISNLTSAQEIEPTAQEKTIRVRGKVAQIDSIGEALSAHDPRYKKMQYDGIPIHTHFADTSNLWIATLDIQTLPGPRSRLKGLVAIRSLTYSEEWPPIDLPDYFGYEILVSGCYTDLPNNEFDTSFPGPFNPGDEFVFPFEFAQLESAHATLRLKRRQTLLLPPDNPDLQSILGIQWCLDEAGDVRYMQNIRTVGFEKVEPIRSLIFKADSVTITTPSNRRNWDSVTVTFDPPPTVGDTSTVKFELECLKNYPDGANFEIISSFLNVLNLPDRVDYPIDSGDVVTLIFDIVPGHERELQTLELNIETARIPIFMMFNDDGTLQAIHYRYFRNLGEVQLERLPDGAFRGYWRSGGIYKNFPHPHPEMIKK